MISHYVITLSEWVSVIIESKPTTNSLLILIQYFLILAPVLLRSIVGCSTFVEDSFEWPQMLLGISTWSHEKSSIFHVLSKLPSHLMHWWEGEFFFHNECKPFKCKNQAQLSSHLWRTCLQRIQFPVFQKMYESIKVQLGVYCSWTSLPCGDLKPL